MPAGFKHERKQNDTSIIHKQDILQNILPVAAVAHEFRTDYLSRRLCVLCDVAFTPSSADDTTAISDDDSTCLCRALRDLSGYTRLALYQESSRLYISIPALIPAFAGH